MGLHAESSSTSSTINTITFEAVKDVTYSWERIIVTGESTTFADALFRNIIERIFFYKQIETTSEKRSSMSHINDKNPSSNPLFKIKSQLFVQMLSVVIDMLGPDLVPMEEMLTDLGAKHLDYGVLEGDYDIIGDALMMTLQGHLPEEWNDQLERSWRLVYNFMASTMKKGSQQEQQRAHKGGGGNRRHLKRSSVPPRHNHNLQIKNDEIVTSLKQHGKGLLGLLDKALVISK
jgi:hypothetical protein